MVMFSGDLHGNCMRELSAINTKNIKSACENFNKKQEDIHYHIILGDVGLLFPNNKKQDDYLIKWFNEKPFITLCVLGNHEAYSEIYKLPKVDIGLGNPVYRVSEKVYYLPRGKIYTIENKTFLVLGGGLSIDKDTRVECIDWWKEEYWNYSEQEELFQTLKNITEVDYVVSHTAPDYFIDFLEQHLKHGLRHYRDDTIRINNEVNSLVKFKHWYCGHYHTVLTRDKYTCLYKEVRFL